MRLEHKAGVNIKNVCGAKRARPTHLQDTVLHKQPL
jgi:hypothetical protein